MPGSISTGAGVNLKIASVTIAIHRGNEQAAELMLEAKNHYSQFKREKKLCAAAIHSATDNHE